jgi:chemotaxis protein CheC
MNGSIKGDALDALLEIGNVSAGMATVALGNLLGMRISIEKPRVVQGTKTNIPAMTDDDAAKNRVGVLMRLNTTLSGAMLIVVDSDFVHAALEKMTGRVYKDNSFLADDESISAISELANIMTAGCMKAIGAYTKLKLYLSPVSVKVADEYTLVSEPIEKYQLEKKHAICVETQFKLMDSARGEAQTHGHIFMLPDGDSVDKLLSALGIEQ